MWIVTLNKSFEKTVEIKKIALLGFLVMKQERQRKKQVRRIHRCTNRKQKRQLDGFLNLYVFGYAGTDVINQTAKVTPGVIKAATNDINDIAEQRINQIISQVGKEVERVLPKLLRGAIEDVYQTPFRVIGNFGKQ